MKSFLSYSAIIEALTGLALILFPGLVVSILFKSSLDSAVANMLAWIAGAAIFSLSLICWLLRGKTSAYFAAWGLLFYNLSLTILLIYGLYAFHFSGPAYWLIIIFHLFQSLAGLILMRKNNTISI